MKTTSSTESNFRHPGWWWLAGAAVIGVGASLQILPELMDKQGGEVPLPLWGLMAISFAQTLAMVFGLSFLGAKAAAYLRLRIFPEAVNLSFLWALLAGAGAAMLAGGIQLGFAPHLPEGLEALPTPDLVTRLFYGGVVEELMVRLGLMTLIAWPLVRLGMARPFALVLALLLSTLLFGLGHLPILAAFEVPFSAPLISYILLANGVFALVAGALYWRYSLVHAMVAHMGFHLLVWGVLA